MVTDVERLRLVYELDDRPAAAGFKRIGAEATATNERIVAGMARAERAMDGGAASATRFGGRLQQVGFQVGDFATQVGAGTSATQALGQQLPQLLGAFGTFGALAGAAAAIMIPLGAGLLSAATSGGTLKDQMKALTASTDAMAETAEAARRPIQDLRADYGDLADEVQRANQSTAAFAAVTAQQGLQAASKRTAGTLINLPTLNQQFLPGDTRGVDQQQRAVAALAKSMGITSDEAERFVASIRSLENAKGPEDVAKASADLLAIYTALPDAAKRYSDQITALTAINEQAARQIEAQRSEVARLLDTYDETTRKMAGSASELERAEAERAAAVAQNKDAEVAQWDRVIAKIREMVYETQAAAQQTDTLFERLSAGAQGFIDRAGNLAKNFTSAQGFEDRYIQERARGAGSKSEEIVRATTAAAEQLGIAAKDLLTVMSFESGVDPSRRGGKGGQYLGLIQFSPENQKRYGVNSQQSVAEQMGAVVRYLKDTGVKPGSSLENIYAAILAGDARRINASDRASGGIVDNVSRDVRGSKFAPHINRAEGMLAAYPDAVLAQKDADRASAQALKEQVEARKQAMKQAQDYAANLTISLVTEQQRADLEGKRAEAIARINAGDLSEDGKAAAIAEVNAELQKQLAIMALIEEAKRRGVDLDAQMVNSSLTYRQAIEAVGETQKQRSIADQRATAETDRLKDSQKLADEQQRTFQEGMVNAIMSADSFGDALKQLAIQILSTAIRAQLMAGLFGQDGQGGGLLSGLSAGIGNLFGGFRAGGGPVETGKAYVVGERRPELFVPRVPGSIIPRVPTGGSTTVTFAPTIVANGAVSQTDLDMAKRQMAQAFDQQFVPALRKHMPNFNTRYA